MITKSTIYMKKYAFIIFALAMIFITSCQTKSKPEPIDEAAAKAAITKLFDEINSAFTTRDVNPYIKVLTDDALVLGTDPKEFWSKTDASQMFTQMFADTTFKPSYKIEKREILVSKDGNSAIVIEQAVADWICPKIPLRRIYWLVRNNDAWQINLDCSTLIPYNEDIPKLNKCLE
jgi:ketosteroid isomerase-like protein